jgi:hypothetical protein
MSDAAAWRWGDVDAASIDGDVRLTHRRSSAELLVRGGRLVRGEGYDGASRVARQELARVGAIVRLRERGRYLVHAAGAVDPGGRAWLLAGDSGCGKSTLGYALARSGWASLGDDGVVIEPRGKGVLAHGWREPLRVSDSLASDFPEIGGGGSAAQRDDPRRRMALSVPFSRGAPIAAVVFLRRSDRHSITRIGPLEALGALIRQSPWVILDDPHTRAHLDALRSAASVPAFRLEHTATELHTLARVLTEAIP